MIRHEVGQGSSEWLTLRSGIPTASELGNLITDKFAIRKGEMVQSYVAQKLAEKWIGGPLIGFGGGGTAWAAEQGQLLETLAIPWLEFEYDLKVERVGFLTTDDNSFGASPDGIIGDEGLEVKCLQPINHVKALMGGVVPEEYLPQIHAGLFVTGFKSWRFLAYNRSFPALWLTVERDEQKLNVIAEALAAFRERFDLGWNRLVELNDGIIPKREPMAFAHEFRSEMPT